MPNVFISHSSHDKPFVRKLASALLSEGFPVWLDAWTIEIGDSLLDQIYEGLERSGVAILVMSREAIASGWVNREVNAALSKEQQTGRKFLIPIKIDDCTVPLKVADRLYSDFSSSFSGPFSALTKVLETQHARDLPVPSDRELLAISFTRAVHLDKFSYAKNLGYIQRRQPTLHIAGRQVVVADDAEYETLMKRLHARMDKIASDPFYSQELESYLRTLADQVLGHERLLSEGIASITNHGCLPEAAYWFARIVRGEAVYRLWTAQSPNALNNVEYGKQWACATLGSDRAAAEFFESGSVEGVHLWLQGTSMRPFSIWVGNEALKNIRNEDGVYEGPQFVNDVCRATALDKYLLPQMLVQHLQKGTPMIWDLEEAHLGLR